MTKVDKLYSLHNSYFKNRKDHYPDSLLEITQYWSEYKQLPFSYSGTNWVYDAMCERQKKAGVIRSQYLTPDIVAEQIAELAENFNPEGMRVLDACCGTGQLSKHMISHGFNVTGFDADPQMVDICNCSIRNRNSMNRTSDSMKIPLDGNWSWLIHPMNNNT